MKKFEVKPNGLHYSIWNNDMQAFQFIYEWNGIKTLFKSTAIKRCLKLNDIHDAINEKKATPKTS